MNLELKYKIRSALGLAWPTSAVTSVIATFAVIAFIPLQGLNGYLVALVFLLIYVLIMPVGILIQFLRFPRTLALTDDGITVKTVFGETKQFDIERLAGIQRMKRAGRQWMILFELTNGIKIFGFLDIYKIEDLRGFSDHHGLVLQ